MSRVSRQTEQGSGVLTTLFGVGALLLFLLLAIQTYLQLLQTSTLRAATFSAARHVAEASDVVGAQTDAETALRKKIKQPYTEITWSHEYPDAVSLSVKTSRLHVLPVGSDVVTASATVHREDVHQ